MRTLLLFLMLMTPLAAAEPSVILGTTALIAPDGTSVQSAFFSPDSERVGIVIDPCDLRYWQLATGKPCGERTLSAESSNYRPACSSDGRAFITYHTDNTKHRLMRYDLAAEKPVTHALAGRPETLIVSESGQFAALEYSGSVRIVQTTDGETIAEFPKIESLRRFSASSDGRSFAFCIRDGAIMVRTAGGPAWSPLPAKKHQYASVALSADGTLLAAAPFVEDADSGTKSAAPVQIWSMKTQQLLHECEAVNWFAEFPNRLRFTPDGKTLLAGDGAFLRGWDAASGKLTFAVEPGWNYPGALVVSPNSRYVAIAYARRAMVWDLTTGKPPPGFEGHTGPVWELAFSPDGKLAATSSYGLAHVLVWEAATGRFVTDLDATFAKTFPESPSDVTPLKTGQKQMTAGPSLVPGRVRILFSRSGRQIATVNEASGAAGPIRLWDVASGRKLWEVPLQRAFAPEVAFTNTGLIAAMAPKPIHFDLTSGKPTWTSEVPVNAVGVKVNRRGDLAAIEDKLAEKNPILCTATGKLIDTSEGVPHAFTPDGRGLVCIKFGPGMTNGFFSDIVEVHKISSGKASQTGKMPMGTAVGKLSPDGEYRFIVKEGVLPGPVNQSFEFREVAGDRLISIASRVDNTSTEVINNWGLEHRPKAFCFSADSRLFAAVYASGLLGVWEVATGETLLAANLGVPDPKFVAFSPDGRRVFTACGEGTGGPVYGFDTTGANAAANLGGSPAAARKAVFALAAKPAEALAQAKAILADATEMDRRQHDAWIANLGAPAFADREAATKGLAEAGWRAEAKLKEAFATTPSEEARQRLAVLLSRRDVRPLRAVHLLELVNTDDAKKLLAQQAAATPETFLCREAKRALARISSP